MSSFSDPRDILFSSQLGHVTRAKLMTASKQFSGQARPLGDLWNDGAGVSWSPMGRLAWLWLTAPLDQHPSNFAAAVEIAKETQAAGHAWHESIAGIPDVVLLWLAHFRAIPQDDRITKRLTGLLHSASAPVAMGEGIAGDGGWLDIAFSGLRRLASGPPVHGSIELGVVSHLYSRLLTANLEALENDYKVWGQTTRSHWSSPQAQAVFERLMLEACSLGVEPSFLLGAYSLHAGCDKYFLVEPSEQFRIHAQDWIPAMVASAIEDVAHPYRFPSRLVERMVAWPGLSYPESLTQLNQHPLLWEQVEQTAPSLAARIQQAA